MAVEKGEKFPLLELTDSLRGRTKRLINFINDDMYAIALTEVNAIRELLAEIEKKLIK